jgi:DNA-binding NarL/FixJ family response regulator
MNVVRPAVLIVDAHDGFREAATSLLEAGVCDVIGTAAGRCHELVEMARLRPGIVLLDIQLRDLDGLLIGSLPSWEHRR